MQTTNSNYQKKNTILALGLIVIAIVSRFISPFNFSPIGAISLFAIAYLKPKYLAIAIPMLAIWISNLVLNNIIYSTYYDGFVWFSHPFVYLSYVLILVMAYFTFKKAILPNILFGAIGSSIIFFLISNFGSWIESPHLYTRDIAGLLTSYIAATPFAWPTLAGDIFYSLFLFGSYYYFAYKRPIPTF